MQVKRIFAPTERNQNDSDPPEERINEAAQNRNAVPRKRAARKKLDQTSQTRRQRLQATKMSAQFAEKTKMPLTSHRKHSHNSLASQLTRKKENRRLLADGRKHVRTVNTRRLQVQCVTNIAAGLKHSTSISSTSPNI